MLLQLPVVALAFWLGAYLLARNPRKLRLRYTGLGLVAYAFSLALDLLRRSASGPVTVANLNRLHRLVIFVPALLWSSALFSFAQDETGWQRAAARFWRYLGLPLALLLLLSGGATELLLDYDGNRVTLSYLLFASAVVAPLTIGLLLIVRRQPSRRPRRAVGLVVVATAFLGLQVGWLLFPLLRLSRGAVVIGVGLDLTLLGLAIALLDAFEEGETLLPDMARSLLGSLVVAIFFGGQVALVMLLAAGVTLPMLALLLTTVGAAILVQVFWDAIQSLLDAVAFGRRVGLVKSRRSLRGAASALSRTPERPALEEWDEEKWVRLTRRALSQFGDLARLTGNPLTRLPIIDERLAARGSPPDTLERAAELKALLNESIARLKPRGEAEFGTSDEWRYYNALYYPYVVGLKPYSRRVIYDDVDPATEEILHWFQLAVPERTLYNWQNAAARLVARDLREKQDNWQ